MAAPDFAELQQLLTSDQWPAAVPPSLVSTTDADKQARAVGVLGWLETDLTNLKVLDYHCGEGFTVPLAVNTMKAQLAVGFDTQVSGSQTWEAVNNGQLLTTDFNKVKALGPFNVVIANDVLDFVADPAAALAEIKSVCDANTLVHIRFHAFCSRHGGHLYRKINKAFAHLVFTPDELATLNFPLDAPIQKVLYPIKTYNALLQQAGFVPVRENMVAGGVEPFFTTNPLVRARLVAAYAATEPAGYFPNWQMSQAFNDVVVKLA